MSSSERYGDDRDRRPYRLSVKCFNCDESGHYANQCPHRERRYSSSRPSTSPDSRRARSPRRFETRKSYTAPKEETELRERVVELTKGVATIKEHFKFEAVQAKKEEKAIHKLEKARAIEEERLKQEEEDARLAQEAARREAKKQKKEAKAKQEAILKAEMKKEVTMHAALLMSEIKDDSIQQWKTFVIPTLAGDRCDIKGKKEVVHEPEYGKKRKRADDVPIGDSPPMEAPPKRTLMRGCIRIGEHSQRVTRARTKGTRTPIRAKKHSPIKTPLSKLTKYRKLSPPSGKLTSASKSLSRLRFRDSVTKELKDCNAKELQRYGKDEGIPYVGKIDAIFDLAEHREQLRFPCIVLASDVIQISESKDVEANASTENQK
ncbi:hypothetical protein CBR_g36864 [Chara braunii]|uniref:CCHC-type domain-containing protein n=1 Tax=Chara braunii TaxID=69332 RepID=A0A388LLQ8_CHABU|nr:hypothetical protein CBR_g36864 [Chara braunii]|eukprot:GBG83249.1 hypothetical protein CBR_g36864 [Chara braunii]